MKVLEFVNFSSDLEYITVGWKSFNSIRVHTMQDVLDDLGTLGLTVDKRRLFGSAFQYYYITQLGQGREMTFKLLKSK